MKADSSRCILLVEDDSLLRSALGAALEGPETTVLAAVATAREAADVSEPYDVLVTDLDLGVEPNGIVLAHALRLVARGLANKEIARELGIALCTGHLGFKPRLAREMACSAA